MRTSSGVANNDPSLSGVGSAASVPGQDIDNIPEWESWAIRRSGTTRSVRTSTWPRSGAPAGNGVGNSATRLQGQLRHPGWQNWDFTLARRIPVNIGRGGSIRVQAQFYDVFDMVQFQRLAASYTFAAPTATNPSGNTNTTTGQYRRDHQPVQLRDHDPNGLLSPTHTPGARELCGHPVHLSEVRS